MGMSYSLVKPRRRRKARARRRNAELLPIHRSKFGTWVSDRGSTAKTTVLKPRRRKAAKKAAKKAPVRRKAARRPSKRKHARKANPPVRRRRRRRSRAVRHNPIRRRRRRRSSARRHNPIRRRRRSARRRRNPGGRIRVFRRRRRHGVARRRNPGFLGTFKEIFSLDTGSQVIAGTVGLSASLWGPKLLGHLVWAPLGRGWGGVASSVVTVGLVSAAVGWKFPRAGKAVLAGGLIGSFAGLLSAIHCGLRTQVLPLETGLLACALPTSPQMAPAGVSTGSAMLQQLIAGGMNPQQAQAIVGAKGMAGLQDFVQSTPPRRLSAGVRDYTQLEAGVPLNLDSNAESF